MAELYVLSNNAAAINARYQTMSKQDIAREYVAYPLIPYNTTIVIKKIGALNPLGKCLNYGLFRNLNPDEFKECVDPSLDYTNDEEVTPITIETNDNNIYRVNYVHWFPLSDAVKQICEKQAKIGRKLLPIELFIDQENQWIGKLLVLGM